MIPITDRNGIIMEFTVTAAQKALQDRIIEFSRRELNENVIERDRGQVFPEQLWRKCAAIGIHGLPVEPAYGGSGLDALSCALALEALGYGCADGGLVFALGAHLLACVVPVWKHGTRAQKQRYLPALCRGEKIGMHALTEAGAGSDSFAMTARAEPDGDGWRLNGVKTLITNSPVADVALVYAVTSEAGGFYGGVTAFIADAGSPGFTVEANMEKIGLRTSMLGTVRLDQVRVSADAVLGAVGAGSTVFTTAMDWERTLLSATLIGILRRLLETSVARVRKRFQFGRAIGKFQAVGHKLADMKVQLEAARVLTYQAAWRLEHARSASLDAAMAKLFVSENLVRAALDALQIHGGYGLLPEYEVERVLRDSLAATIYSGTSEIQRNIIARWLGI